MIEYSVRTLVMMLAWAALQGAFTPLNLAFGALLGLAINLFVDPIFERAEAGTRASLFSVRPVRRLWRVTFLLLVFLRELTTSSLRTAYYVLQPRLSVQPGIIAYPLDVQTDREITALANLISLTPGTLTLDVAEDRSTLYIHAMQLPGGRPESVREDIKRSLEYHVARALGPMRPPGEHAPVQPEATDAPNAADAPDATTEEKGKATAAAHKSA